MTLVDAVRLARRADCLVYPLRLKPLKSSLPWSPFCWRLASGATQSARARILRNTSSLRCVTNHIAIMPPAVAQMVRSSMVSWVIRSGMTWAAATTKLAQAMMMAEVVPVTAERMAAVTVAVCTGVEALPKIPILSISTHNTSGRTLARRRLRVSTSPLLAGEVPQEP